jgi:hypothetical protein
MADIDLIEKGDGWVIIKLRNPADASPASTAALHDKLHEWLQWQRNVRVRAALPFVSQGETIAVHIWTEREPPSLFPRGTAD